MNSRAAPTGCAASSTARARYEQLREHVLGQTRDAHGAPGLAMVMRGGVPACLAASIDAALPVVMPASTPAGAEDGAGVERGMREDIARVVVAMALTAATQREAHV
jgi:hypothetical protein